MANFMPDPFENNSYDYYTPTKSGGGFIGKFVAFLLGIIFFIGGAVATTVAVGSWVLGSPIGETVNKFDSNGEIYKLLFGDGEKLGYLDKTYETKKIMDLVTDIGSAATDLASGNASLKTISKIIPKTKDLVDTLVESISGIGIPLTTEGLMETKLSELPDFLMDTTMDTPIYKFLEGESNESSEEENELIMFLLYGEAGVDYEVDADGNAKRNADGDVIMIGDSKPRSIKDLQENPEVLMDVSLSTFIDAKSDDALMMYVLYGKKDMHYQVVDNKVSPLQKQVAIQGTTLYNEYGEVMTDVTLTGTASYTVGTGEDAITYYLKKNGENQIVIPNTNPEEKADLYYVFSAPEKQASDKVMFEATKLSDLSDADNSALSKVTERLTVGEMMEFDESNKVLTAIKDETIKTLPDAIQTLTLEEVIDIPKDKNDPNYNHLLDDLRETPINELSKDINETIDNLKLEEVIDIPQKGQDGYNKILDKLRDKEISKLSESINGLILEDVIDIPKKGEENYNALLDKLRDKKINELSTSIDGVMDELTLGEVIDIPEKGQENYNALLFKLKDKPIGNLSTSIDGVMDELTLGEVIDIPEKGQENYNALLFKLKDKPIGELSTSIDEVMDTLTLEEVIDIPQKGQDGYNKLLDTLRTTPISNLSSAINTMPIGDMMDGVDTNTVLKHLSDSTIESLPRDIEGLTINAVFEDTIYNDPNNRESGYKQAAWKYMLTNPTTGKEPTEGYTLNQSSMLISNMTANMEKATLGNLKTDGILNLDDTTLDQSIVTKISVPGRELAISLPSTMQDKLEAKQETDPEATLYIRELSAIELTAYMGAMLNVINQINNPS